MEYFLSGNSLLYDSHLAVCQTGWERCEPSHSFGPAVRDHYLIHYCISGKGTYYVGEQRFDIGRGQGFLICPDQITYYEADAQEPWHYVWVGFKGMHAAHCLNQIGLSENEPIFTAIQVEAVGDSLLKLHNASKIEKGKEFAMVGYLYLFLGLMAESSLKQPYESIRESYVARACQRIEMDYTRDLSIAQIAAELGLERSYFSNLFKRQMGMSPQQYLLKFRMEKACALLERRGELSIGDIARSVGYTDPLAFSRMFKSVKGQPPSAYAKLNE